MCAESRRFACAALIGAASAAWGTDLTRYADMSLLSQPEGEAAAAEPVVPPQPKGWFDGWKGGFEVGLAGSEGNTQRLGFRAGVTGQRLTEKYDTRFLLNYVYASTDGDKTDHRFRGELRNDWLLKGRWRLFAQGAVDVDEFQDWEWRLSGYGGVGYQFIKNDKTTLIGRAVGASREFGGANDDVSFEALLGLDITHQVTERQKFTFTGELYPSLSDGGEFRALARAGYEILVDPSVNMTLKLGIEDRYDSDTGPGVKENDLDYFLLLVWSW